MSLVVVLVLIIALRALYVISLEYGFYPKKKALKPNDHIFLTGAADGIGRLLAQALATKNVKLTLLDINSSGLEQTKALCL
jgi:hypothetical protein